MENELIGRIEEQQVLLDALQSKEAEMVAVIGRRRVGKTFLIKSVYLSQVVFEITGLQDAALDKQLQHFSFTLRQYAGLDIPHH